jgi:hypothetical protein
MASESANTPEGAKEGLGDSHCSTASLCALCKKANVICPIWEPGKVTEHCVEHRWGGFKATPRMLSKAQHMLEHGARDIDVARMLLSL